ncbi:hypothetical protein HPB52_018305 [Rhipicephalus sanguineus]|uniref:Uncharacterized protein n=1 Tax=Rhipicephalus sanguineus TaxID=34632 RepID=A0A9D4PRZ9_RHISA|nr:hypothetical protein HPB52_018305 [Rhipicephalus sanguineus]
MGERRLVSSNATCTGVGLALRRACTSLFGNAMSYKVSGTALPATEFNPEEWSIVLNARTRLPRQQSKETEGTQSGKAASADGTQASKTKSVPSIPSTLDDTAVACLRLKGLPGLPVDDFKIVFRPSAGISLAQYNDGELWAVLVANSGLHSAAAENNVVCTNLPKTIFTVSTSCAGRVANYAKIRKLTLRGNKLVFHAYIAPPEEARPGLAPRITSGESPPANGPRKEHAAGHNRSNSNRSTSFSSTRSLSQASKTEIGPAESKALDETVAAKAKALDEMRHKAATSAPNPER